MKLSYRTKFNAQAIAAIYNQPLDKPDWYKITNVSDDEADIYIMGYLGWPYNSADDFVKTLASMTQSKITIRINSPGGDVWDSHCIHNAIKRHKSKPTTCIESLAASAASYIFVAGHKKIAYKNSMIMIHEPMTCACGNQFDLRETADVLSQVSETLVDMYADNTNVGKKEIREMMKAETWMNAKVAKEKGFIDEIIEDKKGVKAEFDLSIFANLPDELQNQEGKELSRKDLEHSLRNAAGVSRSEAKIAASAIIAKRNESDQRQVDQEADETIVIPQVEDHSRLIAALETNINKLIGGK